MKYAHGQAVTVGILVEILAETLDPKFKEIDRRFEVLEERINKNIDAKIGALESKMMEGFEALDRKIDFVETRGEAIAQASDEKSTQLLSEIKATRRESEQRDKLLTNQIMYLTTAKADVEN